MWCHKVIRRLCSVSHLFYVSLFVCLHLRGPSSQCWVFSRVPPLQLPLQCLRRCSSTHSRANEVGKGRRSVGKKKKQQSILERGVRWSRLGESVGLVASKEGQTGNQ